MVKRFMYRSPEIDDKGGNFSLADIEADDESSTEESQDDKEEEEEEDDKKPDEDPNKKPEKEKKDLEDPTKKEKKDAEEEESDKEEEDDSKDKEDDDNDEPDDAEAFYKDVDAIRGDTIEVDYGTVDPLSPEGVVLRERAIEAKAAEDFEAYIEQKYPKAYGYLLHTIAGKPEEEFFGKSNSLESLPTVEEVEASVEVQKEIITQNYIAKGVPEKRIGVILNQLIADNELEEEAKLALTERETARQAEVDRLKADHDAEVELKSQAVKKLNDNIDNLISTGKLGNITIPEGDRKAFAKQIKDGIRYENGKFILTAELSNENALDLFGKEYFAFKKGNLSGLVKSAAKTENVKRLKRTLPIEKTPKGGADQKGKFVPFGDLEAE